MNTILTALPPRVLEISGAETLTIAPGCSVAPKHYVFFPESGAITIMATALGVAGAQVGLNGAFNVLSAFADDIEPPPAICHVPAMVTAIPSTSVAELAAQLPVFRNALIKAQANSDLEMRRTLSCIANHSMHQRFARWLSQLADHHGDMLLLTQEQLAAMLGVTRTSLSRSYKLFSDLIRAGRGSLTILDRAALRDRACNCYSPHVPPFHGSRSARRSSVDRLDFARPFGQLSPPKLSKATSKISGRRLLNLQNPFLNRPAHNHWRLAMGKDTLDLDQLLHPSKAFAAPLDVVKDPDLTTNEKRAILSSWASDVCAVSPELRAPPNGSPVRFDDIMDALKALDGPAAETVDYPRFIGRARRIRDLYKGNSPFA